ncbi:hypothetical protein BST85_01165 [Aureitalea marina]|uniref:Secretion system C-terminal sorting domain-containing protein n=1 Tax=Aureitalea marina TaxID=930804 RepID=A0A2S7KM66_9FLAO|nr:hypothetical protein BST85_01165 [Aureitalea marina]
MLVILLTVPFTWAQTTTEELPYSWRTNGVETVDPIVLPALDLDAIREEDRINDLDKSIPWRYGVERPLYVNMQTHGQWTELENGGRLWRVAIRSTGAQNVSINFDRFKLPKGSRLYFYNRERSDLSPTFTADTNRENQLFGSWFVYGQEIIVEYYQAKRQAENPILQIGSVIHGYRLSRLEALDFSERGLNDSGDCQYDVNCPIGADFDNKKDVLKKAVALLNLGNGYLCTATLLNNTASDKTPFLLTANHCLENSNPALWSVRFNWMSPNPICGESSASSDIQSNFTMSGSQLRASSELSDFALVELVNSIPEPWDVAFAGWDNRDLLPEFEIGIHHPKGDIMKVCRDDSGAVRETADGTEVWLIGGVSAGSGDGWEIGTTESGSSGSPLFDQDGRLIGQLFAGRSACEGNTNNKDIDVYGRFGVSWATGNTPESRLMDWLDPLDTGQPTTETLQNILSVQDFDLIGDLSIFPNPATNYLTVLNYRYPNLSYSLFNLLGQEVGSGSLSDSQNLIPLTDLSEGMYLLYLIDGDSGETQTKKIVVSR